MLKRKFIYLSCVLLFILGITITFLITNKDNKEENDKLQQSLEKYEYLKLNDYLSLHNNTYDDSNIMYIENQKIYGSIYNFPADAQHYTTNYLFLYDIKSKDYKEVNLKSNYTIMDYYIKNEYIYFISIDYSEVMRWELYISDLEFKFTEKIMEGNINSDFSSPKLFYNINSDSVYLLAITNDLETENLNLYRLDGNKYINIFNYNGNHSTKKGTFLQNMLYVDSIKDKLYFTLVYDYKKNTIYEYDLNTNVLNEIFSKDISDCYFTSYYFTELGYYINGINNSGNYDVYFYSLKDNKLNKADYKNELYFGKQINDINLLFHKSNNWYLFNTETNEVENFEIDNNYYIPNYYVLDNDKILIVNDKNNYYAINLH